MPDPLDDGARVRALAPKTLRLRREQIHSAITSAAGAGADVTEWVSLTELVDLENFKSLLRARWSAEGQKLTAYTHGVAGLLITIASEWAKAPSATITKLKTLRRKLGSLAPGLTDKNKGFLRKFADLRLLQDLVQLPEKLWLKSRRALASSRRPFIDLQSALAIDILLHVPLRMANLTAMRFGEHLQWPQGRGKPALLVFHPDETKNAVQMEFELPTDLANRLWVYRTEIIPTVTGTQSDAVFVSWTGTPRKQETITNAIEKTVLRNLGLKMTPHQFRHLAAQIILDANPGAIEVVRQLMAHKNSKTTMNFYAGINTRRAGRAHADLLISLRESSTMRNKRRTIPR
jgi:integrase